MDTKKETKKWSKWIRIMQKLNLDCTGIKTQLYIYNIYIYNIYIHIYIYIYIYICMYIR